MWEGVYEVVRMLGGLEIVLKDSVWLVWIGLIVWFVLLVWYVWLV